jgi:hypothetical protein
MATINDIKQLIEDYNNAILEKERLADETKQNNAEVERLKLLLSDAMIEAEVPSMVYLGYSWSVSPRVRYSKAAGADDELFDQLREDGLGDLIKETVNANTLQAAMKNLAEENGGDLPENYTGLISEYSYNDITRRKSAKKI